MRSLALRLLCLSIAASPALGVDTKPEAVGSAAAKEERPMAAPPDYNSPGPEHARLAAIAGRWTSTYRVTPMPGGKPMDIPGTAEFRSTLGGLWIEGDTELNMGATKIMGRVMYGYDRFKQRYVFLFVQQADTQPLFGYGVPDASGARITFTVPMDIPPINQKAVPVRTVLDLSSADAITFEMNTPIGAGKEFQPLRIDYVRVK